MFLSWAKDDKEAIKKLLDAMIKLESFLESSNFTSKAEYTSGLFKNLHDMMREYWRHWHEANGRTA